MAGRGRPPSAKTLVDRQLGRNTGIVIPAGDPYIIPNHSGDHDAGRILKTPTEDTNIVNKKYVDDKEVESFPTSLTTGSIPFSDGSTLAQNNSKLFWDEVNKRLGIGTNTPAYFIDVSGADYSASNIRLANESYGFAGTVSGGDASQYGKFITANSYVVGSQTAGTRQKLYGLTVVTSANPNSNIYENAGIWVQATHKHSTDTSILTGIKLTAKHASSGTVGVAKGFDGITYNSSSGTISDGRGLSGEIWATGTGTITNAYGVNSAIWRGGGTITNGYLFRGYYIGTVGTKWGVHLSGEDKNYFSGDVGIGTTSPQGKLHVGDQATNYMKVASDGEIGLVGTARVKDCVWIDAASIRAPLTKSATYVAHGLNGAWSFADAVEANQETINAATKIPSNIDRSVAPSFKIAWSADGVSPGNCKWQFEYVWRALNEDTTAAAQETLTTVSTASATSNGLVVAEITGIDLPSSSDECLYFRITRLSADAQDTIADTTELLCICLEFTADKLGTAL